MLRRLTQEIRERIIGGVDKARWAAYERRFIREEPDASNDQLARRDHSGSRFYGQPGFAVLRGEGGGDPSGFDGDRGDAMARVASALGEKPGDDPDLGRPKVVDGSYGRGADSWTAVLEWTISAAGQGIVGLIATAPIIAAARRYDAIKKRMRQRGASYLVNRAGALLIALDDAAEEAPSESRLWLESAEEMSTVAGRPITEHGYVGADSWLVFLVDVDRALRYVRIVSPDGEIAGRTSTSLNDLERLYLPAPD